MPRRAPTPTVLQLEAVECGAACLGMILGYYGRHVPLTELREACGVSRDGSRAAKIVQAARNYGLEAKGLKQDLNDLQRLKAPYIVFWQFNHFVVVEGFNRRGVFLNDPAGGHRQVDWDEFNVSFTGVVLAFQPGPNFQRGGSPARLATAIGRRLRGFWLPLGYSLAAGLLLVAPMLVYTVAASVVIDAVVVEGRAAWSRPLVWILLAAVAALVPLHVAQLHVLRRLRWRLAATLSADFLWRLLSLPMTFYTQRFPGEVASRMRLNDRVADVLGTQLAGTGVALATMALYLPLLAAFSGPLAGIAAGLAAINFVALRGAQRRRSEASQRLAQAQGRLFAASVAGVQAIETLKASGMEDGYFAKWAGFHSRSVVARHELARAVLPLDATVAWTDGLTNTLVLAVGAWLVVVGHLTLGGLIAFQMLLRKFLSPVAEVVQLGGTLHDMHADLLRLDDVVLSATMEPAARGANAEAATDTPLTGEVTADGLVFGYSRVDPPLVDGVSLSLSAGDWVALVGRSGSGKSTLARLLTGLYEPWAGEIRFDGLLRAELTQQQLAGAVAFVDQDVVLFEGTVRENLTLWNNTISDATLVAACRDAEIWPVVRGLPGGLDAPLEESAGNLSGGERQRLELARALVTNPRLLVLDEATSALDGPTEQAVLANLRRRGCTVLLIAHRSSAVRHCDSLVVLDAGRVVDQGTFDQLVGNSESFAELFPQARV